jgi:choline kinase
VDVDWRGRYEDRKDHPIDEAENVIVDANNAVIDIGKIMTSPGDVYGEFIGMMKLTPRGCEIFKRHFTRAKSLFWDKPFQRAATFQNAYITDILKDMAELGVPIQTVIIEQGWQEIDTEEDYITAQSRFNSENKKVTK